MDIVWLTGSQPLTRPLRKKPTPHANARARGELPRSPAAAQMGEGTVWARQAAVPCMAGSTVQTAGGGARPPLLSAQATSTLP
eukprot:gene20646-biopygen11615